MARAVPEPSGTRWRCAISHRCKVSGIGLARSCHLCAHRQADRPRLQTLILARRQPVLWPERMDSHRFGLEFHKYGFHVPGVQKMPDLDTLALPDVRTQ